MKKSLGFEDKNKAHLSDTDYFLSYVDESIDMLDQRNIKPAAVIVDPIFSSSGVLDPPPNYLEVIFLFLFSFLLLFINCI